MNGYPFGTSGLCQGSGTRNPNLTRLPVNVSNVTWIQWPGATEVAYQDHLNYMEDPKSSMNYDGYCQGLHCGLDLGAEWDTPVYAGVYGKAYVTTGSSGDWMVEIWVGDYKIIYQHLSNPKIENGTMVNPDTIIGGVGNISRDPLEGNIHLHLEIRYSSTGHSGYKDRIANPLLFIPSATYIALSEMASIQDNERVNFHPPFPDDAKMQPFPVHRGGGVLWR